MYDNTLLAYTARHESISYLKTPIVGNTLESVE